MNITWGEITYKGKKFRDCIVCGNNVEQWDWVKTGTHHNPGIMVDLVESLVENTTRIAILSRGVHGVLQIHEDVIRFLNTKNIKIYTGLTPDVIDIFNSLNDKDKCDTIGLFHSTC